MTPTTPMGYVVHIDLEFFELTAYVVEYMPLKTFAFIPLNLFVHPNHAEKTDIRPQHHKNAITHPTTRVILAVALPYSLINQTLSCHVN